MTVRHETAEVARRTLVVVAIVGLAMLLAFLMRSFGDVFLLAFASVLVALLLRGLADALGDYFSLSDGRALALVLTALLITIALGIWLLAARIAAQANDLVEALPRGLDALRQWAEQFSAIQPLVRRSFKVSDWLLSSSVFSHLTDVVSTVVGTAVDALVVVVVAIYLAANPRVYIEGSLQLVPVSHRPRVAEVFDRLGATLRWWMVGRVGLMGVNAAVTAVGLWLLGVPLALTLGLLSGLLNFIPNVGPILAAAPAILIALTQGPTQALYVTLLYVAYQSVDGYLLTPIVTQRTVSVPPAVTLLAQLLLGASAGLYGLLLASPLTAAVIVAVRLLYVEDALQDGQGESTADRTRHNPA